MTDAEKLTSVKSVLGITGTAEDTSLSAYLALAEAEILAWLYSGNTPDDVTDVPYTVRSDADHGRCGRVQQGGGAGHHEKEFRSWKLGWWHTRSTPSRYMIQGRTGNHCHST